MIPKRQRKPEHFYCSSGSPDRTLYVLDGDTLIEAGVEDTQAIINSYKDSCDIKLLIERVTQGEYDLLMQRRGVYVDTTKFPTNIVEAQNMLRESKSQFEMLPDDIKKEVGGYEAFSKWSDDDYAAFIKNHQVVSEAPKPVEEIKEVTE